MNSNSSSAQPLPMRVFGGSLQTQSPAVPQGQPKSVPKSPAPVKSTPVQGAPNANSTLGQGVSSVVPSSVVPSVVPSVIDQNALSSIIERWRDTDAKIKGLTQALAQQRAIKTSLNADIIRIMEREQLGAIDLKNGKMRLVTDQPFKVLTKRSLGDILAKYQDLSPQQVSEVMQFILSNRERNKETTRIVYADKS